jgi:methylenetetrahydrofolate reductase (NADPH)
MMDRIGDLVAAGPTLSAEFFPPKTAEGMQQLEETLDDFEPLGFSFVSVTYGAGGTTRDTTRDIVVGINEGRPFPAMAHLTCIGHTRQEIDELLVDYREHGVHNILALAGDPPADGSPVEGDFTYASELVEQVIDHDHFSIGVAAFPELHPRSEGDRAQDRRTLAAKLNAADFGVTQFFFDADDYFRMVDELAVEGCDTPVLPGIMPLTNTTAIRRFAKVNGSAFPEALGEKVDAAGSEEEVLRIAVDAAAELSQKLIDGGIPGLHLYSLNRSPATVGVIKALGLR